eukprot:12885893-Prorocentrum_lima.AAC.1
MLIHEPLCVPVQQEARVSHLLDHHDQDPAPYTLPREVGVRIKEMAKEPKEQPIPCPAVQCTRDQCEDRQAGRGK